MPYPEDELHSTEELILDLHPHWWFFAKSAAMLALAVILAIVTLSRGWPSWISVPVAVFVFATLVWFLQRYIRWVSTHFVLTSDRVIFRTGIIAKHGIEIPLERINTIFFHQRIFERMLGLGDLDIESASKDGAQRFEDIRNPSAVQNEIYKQMEANEIKAADRISSGINRAQGAAGSESIPDQIAKLSALRDQGVLTEDEFQMKKQELLGRM
jgi:uncharacterized membrane protein YdbT with pleckstrin-like domain